jgi:hypothetical protein
MRKLLIIAVSLVVLAALAGGGWWLFNNRGKINTVQDKFSPSQAAETLKQKALEQAKSYKPDGICAMAQTKARHKATGLEYTFPSSCLPPGWETVQQ